MTDGSSPALPAPQTDTLFSLLQLSFPQLPLPPCSFLHLSLQFFPRAAVSAKVTPSNTHPAVLPTQKHTQRLLLASLQTLNAQNLYLHNTAWLAGEFLIHHCEVAQPAGAVGQGLPGLSECGWCQPRGEENREAVAEGTLR